MGEKKMNCSADNTSKLKHLFLLTVCVFVSMLFCCAYTSPIYPYYNNSDSAIFMLIGRGIAEGKLCYVDLFDHKGPILFFIQAIGWKIGGRSGIWFIECIAVLVSALAIEGICRELKAKFFVPLAASAMVLYAVFCHGNLSEDYSLPFVYISLFFAVKHFVSGNEKHPAVYALFYGMAFGVIAFIRVNNALIICALVLCIAIDLIAKKQYKNLFANLLAGAVGIAVIAVPVCLYFYMQDALYEMLYATFLYNLVYAGESTHAYVLGGRLPFYAMLYAPIIFALVIFVMKRKSMPRPLFLTMLTASVLSLIMLVFANIYEHYFTNAIPMFTVAAALAVPNADLKTIFNKHKKNAAAAALGVIVVVYIGFAAYRAAAPMYKSYLTDISYDRYHQMNQSAQIIPEQERDSVIGFEIPPEWYMDCDIVPCYKYYIMQHWWTNSAVDVYGDFLNYLNSEHPAWIITKAEISDEGVSEVLEKSYSLQETNDYACFYKYMGD